MNGTETMKPEDSGSVINGGVGTFGPGLISGGEFYISTSFLQQP